MTGAGSGREARPKIRAGLLPEALPKGDRRSRVGFSAGRDLAALQLPRRVRGRHLFRSNLTDTDPARLPQRCVQPAEVEARIEVQRLSAILAFCVRVTLTQLLKQRGPGLTPHVVLEKLAAMQRIAAPFPTTDGGALVITRYTESEAGQPLLLAQPGRTSPRHARAVVGAKRRGCVLVRAVAVGASRPPGILVALRP